MDIVSRFFDIPPQSFFLFGPRGTGKSTWLRNQLPESLFLDLLEPELYRSLQARPERLHDLRRGSPDRTTIVIDEIQRVPELLTVVHAILEQPDAPRFVLTASSARKLRRGGVDLLGGRALYRSLHPFMASELPSFDLEQSLYTGLLPLVLNSADAAGVLNAYINLYIDEEVKSEGLTRNIGQFTRFLEAVSFSHGSQLNVAAVARDCEVERKVVAAYIEILEDLLLAYRLPVFTKRAKRQTVSHDKLYIFDAGVFRSLRPKGPLDRPEEINGLALEGLVAQHLRAWISYSRQDSALYFWRTKAGSEVDFIIYGEAGFWAIETKNAGQVHRKDLRALRTFRDDYPETVAIMLYRGHERLRIDGIWCIPVDEFLMDLKPNEPVFARTLGSE